MDIQRKHECEKYTIQLFNWLKMRYPDYVYDYLVLEDENFVTMEIKMNIEKKDYEKRGTGILRYVIKTFKYPELLKINWRYNHNMFNINVICGNDEQKVNQIWK